MFYKKMLLAFVLLGFLVVSSAGFSAKPGEMILPDIQTVNVEKIIGKNVVARFVWRRMAKKNTFEVFLIDGNKERKLKMHALLLDIGAQKHLDKNWVRFQAPDTNDQVLWFEALYVGGITRVFKDGKIENGRRGNWRGTF